MSILKVARMGHPVLRERARVLERSEILRPAFQTLIDDMIETMVEYRGVGLAAPQVHHGVRLFVASLGSDDDEGSTEPYVIVNPEVVPVGTTVEDDWEGCLSIPDIRGRVPRAHEVRLRALDRKGDRLELKAHGFPARIIQHENDHLDGVLFFDRMKTFETLAFLDEYSKYWIKDED